MGYINENGEYVFQSGFGSGLEGSEYRADRPQGEFGPCSSPQRTRFGGVLPYWVTDNVRRARTFLVFLERRANRSVIEPPGALDTRLEIVTSKLESARQKEIELLRERADFGTPLDTARLRELEKQGEFTAWATAVLCDYFYTAADSEESLQSWDAGQCAYRNGDVKKISVKQLIRKVDAIGRELYPAPKG